jgi:hypothetical protein
MHDFCFFLHLRINGARWPLAVLHRCFGQLSRVDNSISNELHLYVFMHGRGVWLHISFFGGSSNACLFFIPRLRSCERPDGAVGQEWCPTGQMYHPSVLDCTLKQTGTVRVFRQKFTLEDAIGSHACSLEANMRVTSGIPLGSSLSYQLTL